MPDTTSTGKINEIMTAALDKIRSLADAQTIIGAPISTPGGPTVIPVSKVSVGFASGGLDYNGKAPEKAKNFGGGGGTGISVTPVAFLVISPTGAVEMLSVNTAADPVEKIASLVDKTPDIVERLKAVFAKKKDGSAPSAEATATEAPADTAATENPVA